MSINNFFSIFDRNQLKGAIFLAGGLALLFFTFDILSCISSLILMAFSLIIIVYGLMKGHLIDILRNYIYSSERKQSSSFEKEHVKAFIFIIGGALLFLYATGILSNLTRILLLLTSAALILYGLKLTNLISFLAIKTREQETKNEVDDRKFKH